MFDYYRVRFSALKGGNPELGYELAAPIGVMGVVLFFLILFLTSDQFGWLMWRSATTAPSLAALGITILLSFLAYIADDLGRSGLIALFVIGIVLLVAVAPLTFALHQFYAEHSTSWKNGPPSALAVGAAFTAYLSVVVWLTKARIRG